MLMSRRPRSLLDNLHPDSCNERKYCQEQERRNGINNETVRRFSPVACAQMTTEGTDSSANNDGLTAPESPLASDNSGLDSSAEGLLDLRSISPGSLEEFEDGIFCRRHPTIGSPKSPLVFVDDLQSDCPGFDNSGDQTWKSKLRNEPDAEEICNTRKSIPSVGIPSDPESPSLDSELSALSDTYEPLYQGTADATESGLEECTSRGSDSVEVLEQPDPSISCPPFVALSSLVEDPAEWGPRVTPLLASHLYQSDKAPKSPDSDKSDNEPVAETTSPVVVESEEHAVPLASTSAAADAAAECKNGDKEESPILLATDQSTAERLKSCASEVSEPSDKAVLPHVDVAEAQEPSTSLQQDGKFQDEAPEEININELVDELNVSESESNDEGEGDDDDDDDIAQIFGENSDDEDRVYVRHPIMSSPSPPAYKEDGEKDEEMEQAESAISHDPDFVSDFDLMMQKRKAENRKRRSRQRNYDFITDSDDTISAVVNMMNKAAKADRLSNMQQKPALSKRKLLPKIIATLKKCDSQSTLIELGVITSISEWLQLLPDKSLPAYEVRNELLKFLGKFPVLDQSVLRSSNIGKVVMLLSKHPKETKENKALANKLIREWMRPILNLHTDFSSLSREERMRRDYEHMPAAKKSRLNSIGEAEAGISSAISEKIPGPGDKDFIARARVPKPSTKDYVIRPKSNVDIDFSKKHAKKTSPLDRKIREIKDRMKSKKNLKAVSVSIEGRKMLQ
uniref:TFIIS N-terminal domain-containing protein n=1 Tax=Trichuris muris TaxID=70415 RepID=A0A5S6R1T1_TRIMR